MTQMYPKNGLINKLDALIIQLIHLFVFFIKVYILLYYYFHLPELSFVDLFRRNIFK